MIPQVADAIDLHWLEFDAGTSNTIILSDRETSAAQDFLAEMQHDLKSLDLEISRLHAIINDLNAKRELVIIRANRIRTALTPLKRIPHEILANIFSLTIEGLPFKLPLHLTESWPWPLRSVCSRWRQVAISTKRLWSSPVVHIDVWDVNRGRHLFLLMAAICCGENASPDKIGIQYSGDNYGVLNGRPYFREDENPMVHLVTPFLPVLRQLSFSSPLSWFSKLFETDASDLVFLETLHLECLPDRRWDFRDADRFLNGLRKTHAFRMAKKLRTFKFSSRLRFSHLEDAALPWNQLVDLDLRIPGLNMESVVSILRQCPRLVTCYLKTEFMNELEFTLMEDIVLSDLRSITMDGYIHAELFAYLVTPSLKEIHFRSERVSSSRAIATMLSNSGSSLQVFEFNEKFPRPVDEDQVTVDMILESSPALVEFDCSLDFSVSTMEKISRGEILPCLEVLKCGLPLDFVDKFVDAVETRLRGYVTPLAKLREVWGRLLFDSLETQPPESAVRHAERIRHTYGTDFKLEKDRTWYKSRR
ncbi:hypothetical protein Hypma_002936 [Hypsizygus marmoreus]|uniref:Uncharacterized protein n=1 Tax=Hypsizygus marmoreus TaxID=39966 RepID=A0A369JA07_HYPMA|nr:hypothetical protein Hypma_002936 [Hypsizygus marmoreus]